MRCHAKRVWNRPKKNTPHWLSPFNGLAPPQKCWQTTRDEFNHNFALNASILLWSKVVAIKTNITRILLMEMGYSNRNGCEAAVKLCIQMKWFDFKISSMQQSICESKTIVKTDGHCGPITRFECHRCNDANQSLTTWALLVAWRLSCHWSVWLEQVYSCRGEFIRWLHYGLQTGIFIKITGIIHCHIGILKFWAYFYYLNAFYAETRIN